MKEVFIPLNILYIQGAAVSLPHSVYDRFYSLGTTPLVMWNFTNFTIFIFIFSATAYIRTVS
jgi:hypothetical protein